MLRARAHELDQSGDLGFIVGVVFCALIAWCSSISCRTHNQPGNDAVRHSTNMC
jgi:hypothetical protein